MEQLNIVPDLIKTMDKKLNKKKNIFQNDSEEERITILDWLVLQLTVPKLMIRQSDAKYPDYDMNFK